MSPLFSLKGRVALVTGASRGLGFAMARALGFAVQASAEPSIAHVRLDLHQPDAAIPGR